MKNLIIIIYFSLCSWLSLKGQTAEYTYSHTPELSFPGEFRSPNIPLAVGTFFEIPASCAKKPTAFIRSDRFIFPEASIGKIDSCSLTYELVNDTIRKVIITLPSASSIKQAGKQGAKQFGKPVYHKEGVHYVYAWSYKPRGMAPFAIRLEVNEDQASGMMYVTAGV
jgi:hypothetical protein